MEIDSGEPTHTLVPCWMPKSLSPKNHYTSWFIPAYEVTHFIGGINFHPNNTNS